MENAIIFRFTAVAVEGGGETVIVRSDKVIQSFRDNYEKRHTRIPKRVGNCMFDVNW